MKSISILIVLVFLFAPCLAQKTSSMGIKAYSQAIGLPDLEQTSFENNDFEVRIWVGSGLFKPRLFLFRQNSSKNFASYYNYGSIPENTRLNEAFLDAPKSGWSNLEQYLSEQEINLNKRSYPENDKFSDPDEEIVVIEMKNKNGYLLASYPVRTTNARGKKVIALCRKIEKEFAGVRLIN
jgi:hypothetical protein